MDSAEIGTANLKASGVSTEFQQLCIFFVA
jgi:hypothetical protein